MNKFYTRRDKYFFCIYAFFLSFFFFSVSNSSYAQCGGTRTVSDSYHCENYAGIHSGNNNYVIFLSDSDGKRNFLRTVDLKWEEFSNGTAKLTGRAKSSINNEIYKVDATFKGRTTNRPSGSPYKSDCYTINYSGWQYYPELTGTIESTSRNFKFTISRRGASFQLGQGASVVQNVFGASGWFNASRSDITKGDFNLRLGNLVANKVANPGKFSPASVAKCTSNSFDPPAIKPSDASCVGSTNPTYRWQVKNEGGGSWTNISGATGAAYNPPAQGIGSKWYRRLASCPCQANIPTTNVYDVHVYNPNSGSISGNQSKCGGYNPSNITSTAPAKNGKGTITYRWQQKIGTGNWTLISGATGATYDPGNITKTTQYRRQAKFSGAPCTAWKTSNVITKTVKAKPDVKTQANIANTGWQFKSSITVCEGTKVGLAAHPTDDATTRWNWTGPNGFTATTRYFTLSNAIKTSMAGTYTATYKNASSCTGSAQIKITVDAIPKVSSISKKDATCGQNNGSITINFPDNSGRSQIAFSLNGGSNYKTAIADNSKTVTYGNLSAGAYEIYARWGDNDCPVKVGSRTINTAGSNVKDAGTFSPGSVIKCTSNSFDPSMVTPSAASCVGGENPTYRWQVKNEGSGSWTNISGATGAAYNPPAQGIGSKWYRRLASCPCQANIPTTNVYDVHVYNPNSGSISGNQSKCGGYNPSNITSTAPAKNGKGTITYRWQQKIGTGNWTLISGATGATYDPGNITKTTQYRRQAKFSGPQCTDWKTSNVITKAVDAIPKVSSISKKDATCGQNNGSITINFPDNPDRGGLEFSLNGGSNYKAAVADNSKTVTYGNLSAGAYEIYARWGDNDCPVKVGSRTINTAGSNVKDAGTFSPGSVIKCTSNSFDPSMVTPSAASCVGGENPTYRWQVKNEGSGSWTNISGATSAAYNPPAQGIGSKWYRRLASCPCQVNIPTTNVYDVHVYNPNPGSISGNQSKCGGYNPSTITSTAPAKNGKGTITYRWQQKIGTGNWTLISGATGATYDPGNITKTTQYRRQAKFSGPQCTDWKTSNVITKAVDAIPKVSSISKKDATCGQNNGSITINFPDNPDRGGLEFSLNGGSNYKAAVADNSKTVTYGNLSAGAYEIYARWGDNDCPVKVGSRTINTAGSNVKDAGTFSPGSVIKCTSNSFDPSMVTPSAASCVGGENPTYRWQVKNEGSGSWTNISGATSAAYNPPAQGIGSKWYRRLASCPCQANIPTTNVFDVHVYNPAPGSISGNQSKCGGYNPSTITSTAPAKNGKGTIAYRWQQKIGTGNWTVISGATGATYDPGNITKTTQYRRQAKFSGPQCTDWKTSNVITKTVKAKPEVKTQANLANTGWQFKGSITVCEGTKVGLAAHPTDDATTRWNWTGPNGFTATTRYFTLSNAIKTSMAGTYTATYKNASGCTGSAQIKVTVDAIPRVSSISKKDAACGQNNGSITINFPDNSGRSQIAFSLNGGESYRTNVADNSKTVTYSNLGVGAYEIYARWGDNDCPVKVGSRTINNTNVDINASINKSNDITCEKGSATLTANPAGLSYKWSNGSTNRTITVGASGTYRVTVTGANGCTKAVDKTVNGDESTPNASIDKSNNLTCEKQSATLTARPAGLSYKWSNGSTNRTITVSTTGTYSVEVTADNGCTSTVDMSVSGGCNPTARVGNEVFNDANNNGFKDNNESGINGVEVKLLATNGNLIATTTTVNGGMYFFNNLESGSYKIMFGTPNGFMASPRTGFGDNDVNNNSDNNPNNGNMTDVFFLSPGESNNTIDAGFFAGTMCDNLTFGGKIGFGNTCAGTTESCNSTSAPQIGSCQLPSGGSGTIEYIWLKNEVSCSGPTGSVAQMIANPDAYNWKIIFNSNSPTFNPGTLTTSTCFLRCARRVGCELYLGESNIVQVEVNDCNGGGSNTGGGATETCGNGTSITYGNGSITMSGQTGLAYFFQVLDAGWSEVDNCGWQCGSSRTVNNLAAGEYRIYIKNSDYQVICEKVITLSAGGTDGGNTGGTDGGNTGGTDGGNTGGTDGGNTGGTDGATETCGNGTSITYGNGSIMMSGQTGLEYFFQVLDAGWSEVDNCGWQCGSSRTVNNLAAGEYRIYIKNSDYQVICEKVITLSAGGTDGGNTGGTDGGNTGGTDGGNTGGTDGGNTGGTDGGNTGGTDGGNTAGGTTTTCGAFTITYGAGSIEMKGAAGQQYYYKINDLHNNWTQVFHCAWECGHEQIATDLPNSKYLITIYNDDWSKHCDTEIEMTNSSYSGGAGSRNAPELNFAAFKAQRTVELQWLTNTGYKNDYFEIEHSTDGQAFKTIQNLTNKEWTDELAYHKTTDAQPTVGSNYYRVKQIYLDGSFDYTPIQQVDFNINLNKINVFPNPAQDELFINLVPYAGKKGSMVLNNQYGQTIQEFNLETVDRELIKVNTSKMENGLYYLMIKLDNQQIFTEKVMIHRLY